MDKLPNEVLITIFKYLHFQQKLKCMLVCRKFAQILSVGYLFETINIGRKGYDRPILAKRRNAVIDRAKNEPRYGKKCKRLLIDTGTGDNLNIENLAATFPNLCFFHISQNLIDIPPAEHTQVDPFEGWKNNLETLYVNSRSMASLKNILNQGVFSRLSTINFKVNNRLPTRSVTCDIFSVLCYAPALTTLGISDCLMSITNLEILHKNAPQLTSLTIENGTLWGPVNLQLLNIKPTENMGILNIMDIDRNRNGRDSLVEYITLKYTHLDQFLYSENDIDTNVNGENEEIKPEWLDLISAIGPRLKLCRIKLATKNPQLITLSASLSTQLKDLGIYDYYPPSSVYKIVPESLLTSVTSLSLDSMYGGFELPDLKALPQLKELKLNSKYRMTISLNSIVTNLPKGTNSLSLKNAKIGINGLELDTQSNINCLKLYDSTMNDTDTSTFLTLYFQKLKSLTLYNCTLSNFIDLPNHHLDFVEYSPHRVALDSLTGYQLTISDRTYYSTLDPRYIRNIYDSAPMEKTDRSLHQVMIHSEKKTNMQYFHFRCASLQTAYFGHYYLLL